ncbi:acetolactate decarboxylase [Paenibacillus glycinis]|uniref:Alpha-acetolactate decarboxylase n=1 Tax=Paenibacillus glycinis TaxID=2697035 RepID=A0ABW9XXP1_9BACL|nr:acetolactate decarboxylase [Paenibacillus glycinis]NBD27012.1 acetolactate decarboxylase [Paenibacillus glycinis]
MKNRRMLISTVALLSLVLAETLTAFASGSAPTTLATAEAKVTEAEKAQAAAASKLAEAEASKAAAEAKLAEAKSTKAAAEAKVAEAKAAKAAAKVQLTEAESAKEKISRNNSTLYQYSAINALMQGQFDGDKTLGEVAEHGDTGLGTFNGVNGELTQMDGKFYRFDNNGHFLQVDNKEKTPFVSTVFFQSEKTIEVGQINEFADLTKILSAQMSKKNNFYAFKVHGTLNYLKVRSEPKQEKPYPTLPKVLENQSVWEYQNVTGTLVVFYTPNYAAMLNVPGFHAHFVSDDKKIGGHVLNLKMVSGTAQIDPIEKLQVELPQSPEFHDTDLTQVDPADVHNVETDH